MHRFQVLLRELELEFLRLQSDGDPKPLAMAVPTRSISSRALPRRPRFLTEPASPRGGKKRTASTFSAGSQCLVLPPWPYRSRKNSESSRTHSAPTRSGPVAVRRQTRLRSSASSGVSRSSGLAIDQSIQLQFPAEPGLETRTLGDESPSPSEADTAAAAASRPSCLRATRLSYAGPISSSSDLQLLPHLDGGASPNGAVSADNGQAASRLAAHSASTPASELAAHSASTLASEPRSPQRLRKRVVLQRPASQSSLDSAPSEDEQHQQQVGLFPNKEEMRAAVMKSASFYEKSSKDPDSIYKSEGCCSRLVRNKRFDYIMFAVIALNALWLAFDADLREEELLVNAHWIIQIIENSFCFIYVVEWLARFSVLKRCRFIVRDRWLLFDTSLVFLMVLETWVLSILILAKVWGSSRSIPGVGFVRVMRLLRLARLSRLLRLLRKVPEVVCLLKGMWEAMRAVVSLMAVLSCLIYTFAIVLRQLSRGTDFGKLYFKSVPYSMYTLVLKGAFLDDISTLMAVLLKQDPLCALVMGVLILIAAVTMMNMLIGILCEVMSTVNEVEKEALAVSFLKREILACLQDCDVNHDGKITKEEFEAILKNKKAVKALKHINVDTQRMVEFGDFFFQSDAEGKKFDRELDFDEFLELILKLRGQNPATVTDIVDLKAWINLHNRQCNHDMIRIDHQLQKLQESMDEMELVFDPDLDEEEGSQAGTEQDEFSRACTPMAHAS